MFPNRRRAARRRRAALRTGAAIVLTAGSLAAGIGPAGATSPLPIPSISLKNPPTETATASPNGRLRIHRARTPIGDPRNQPHVCRFYFDVTGFGGSGEIIWAIFALPRGTDLVNHGIIHVDSAGAGHTAIMRLPNGRYGLLWGSLLTEEPRHKRFRVRCRTKTPTPTPTPTQTTSTPTPTPTTPAAAPTPTPVDTDLPVTG